MAYAQYRLGGVAEAQGRFAAAAETYAAALAHLRAAGPPHAEADAAVSAVVRTLRPDAVLLALGLARKRQGDVVAAERAYTDALAEDAWPPEPASRRSP